MYVIPKIIRKIVGVPAIKHTEIGSHSKVDSFSVVVNSSLGNYSYIGEHSSVIHCSIGKYCSISTYCAIGGGAHPIEWISTSPVFNMSNSILHYRIANNLYEPFAETQIGNDVWIGSHCLIKSGVTIGDGAVIGMGSVVTKDIAPYEIWAGNPAKLIRKRFSEEIIESLLKSKWWDKSEIELKKMSQYFNMPEKAVKFFNLE